MGLLLLFACAQEAELLPPCRRVSIKSDRISLKEVAESIGHQTGYKVEADGAIGKQELRRVDLRDLPVMEALDALAHLAPGIEVRTGPRDRIALVQDTCAASAARGPLRLTVDRSGAGGLSLTIQREPGQVKLAQLEMDGEAIGKDESVRLPIVRNMQVMEGGTSSSSWYAGRVPDVLSRIRLRIGAHYVVASESVTIRPTAEPQKFDRGDVAFTYWRGMSEIRPAAFIKTSMPMVPFVLRGDRRKTMIGRDEADKDLKFDGQNSKPVGEGIEFWAPFKAESPEVLTSVEFMLITKREIRDYEFDLKDVRFKQD